MSYKTLFLSIGVLLTIHSIVMFWIFHQSSLSLTLSTTISHQKIDDVFIESRDSPLMSLEELDGLWEEEIIRDLMRDEYNKTSVEEVLVTKMSGAHQLAATLAHDASETGTKAGKLKELKTNESKKDSSESESEDELQLTKMILILTESRHGSTWLMDLLSYPETSVPVFEPLNMAPYLKMYAQSEDIRNETLAQGYDPVIYSDWRAVFLSRICLCDFNKRLIRDGRAYGGVGGLGYKAKRLGTEFKYEYQRSLRICPNSDSFTVPKTIRLYNISELQLLPGLGCDNFKIIQLIRDPRAVMFSRIDVFRELYDGNKLLGERMPSNGQEEFSEEYMRRASRDLCSHHLHNFHVGMNPPAWLRNRYKLVKYEDLATQPDKWAEELFRFAGIPYTDEYKQYVYNTTHIKERGKKDRGSYAVEREAAEVVNSWRTKLFESHWKTIEQECAELMRVMGYDLKFS